jgi:signal transduction histidine kinase
MRELLVKFSQRACWPLVTRVLPMAALALFGAALLAVAVFTGTATEALTLFGENELIYVVLAVGLATAVLAGIMGQVSRSLDQLARGQQEAQRRAEEKAERLRGTLDDMRQLDRAKDEFLILISHEVRTPLTAIMGGVDFLKSSVARVQGPDRRILDQLNIAEIAEIIEGSGQRLKNFMNDAIQMTAIQSRHRSLELVAVPAASLVEIGLCGIREKAAPREVTVTNELEAGVDWAILGDQKVLKLAFERVMHNALKHNRHGGRIVIREAHAIPDLGVRDWLPGPDAVARLKNQPAYAHWNGRPLRWRLIEVFNTGEPIPEDRQEALFGKFELVGRIEHHQKGSGLSLPIAGAAIETHGGRIFVRSHPGDGNSFFLLLPTIMDVGGELAGTVPGSRNDEAEGVGGRSGDEEIDLGGDPAGFDVELDDAGAPLAGGADETGGWIDRPGRAHHQEEITV